MSNNNDMIIIKDTDSDNYYYIHNANVFKCSIFDASNFCYKNIAKSTKQNTGEAYDKLIDKLYS